MNNSVNNSININKTFPSFTLKNKFSFSEKKNVYKFMRVDVM